VFGVLLLAFLVVPLLEVYVFVQVADAIGFLPTVAWIVAISLIGAWVVKREGMSTLRRANEQVARGQVPTDALVDGVLLLFGGALLLTPGFTTDVLGLVLVLPPTRALLRGTVKRRFVASGPILAGRITTFGPAGDGSWEEPDGSDRPELR